MNSIKLAFTIKADGILKQIRTDVTIHPVDKKGNNVKANAIWDTGATRTCISRRLASLLNVSPIGMGISHTANGPCQTDEYLIRLELPGGSLSPVIRCATFNGSTDIDVLVGMDLISTGDFSITNAGGKTYVSFRSPSDYRHIDYNVAMRKDKKSADMREYIKKNQTT